MSQDVDALQQCVSEVLHEWGLDDAVAQETFLMEMLRCGGAELHAVAALIGGVAAQEVIKVITHQYTPFDNTFIYNGLNSTTTTMSL